MNTRTESQHTTSEGSRLAPPLSWMVPVWGVWFLVYFGGGALALSQGETGFFAATVDRVEALWVKLALLNLPLQLVLVAVALVAARLGTPPAERVSRGAAWLVTGLIAAHVVLSLVLELRLGARI